MDSFVSFRWDYRAGGRLPYRIHTEQNSSCFAADPERLRLSHSDG